jgi:hypothetical protein
MRSTTAAWSASASSERRSSGDSRMLAWLVSWPVEAHDADKAALGAQRQEQALGARQRVGGAAGGLAAARSFGAARSASSSRADRRTCNSPFSGSRSTTWAFSIKAILCATAQQVVHVADAGGLRLKP